MSVQFGRWNLDGGPVDRRYVERVGTILCRYGPDGEGSYGDGNIAILYRAFHTTKESRGEVQPHISASRAVITWDGRLDNRADLVSTLRDSLTLDSADVAIVAAAYDKWGTNCFSKLIGDWALSIWNPDNQSVLLAKDPIGTRHLYYSFDDVQISWSSVLDPLTRIADKIFQLNEEYVAGWLAMSPAVQLTPWVGVHAVPPSTFVILRRRKHVVRKYWDFDPTSQIRYRTDAEYEEHFRAVFSTAVQRRLRSDRPVLAELSGGRDSSAIVCMADDIIARARDTRRVDTVSYYDDSEPNWNERPYFTKVEEKRGRTGWHVDVSRGREEKNPVHQPPSDADYDCPVSTPASNGRTPSEIGSCMVAQGNRALLSGIGGDEIMGGVPTPAPELEDLIFRAQFGGLAHQLKVWALEKRKPWLQLLWEGVRGFFPVAIVGVPKYVRPVPWLNDDFVKRHWSALTGYPSRLKVFGPLPSFQENLITLDGLRRQLASVNLPFGPPFEKRYPYLDRSLLEFVFAIPRAQLVRPTQRRSLMRRALVGIVPSEILNRKAKAFSVRAQTFAVANDWASLMGTTQNMESSLLGMVNSQRISEVLQKMQRGEDAATVGLVRTIFLERWLRHLRTQRMVDFDRLQSPEAP
jgi:asparagine synthase (glutamine-hydrolysing)